MQKGSFELSIAVPSRSGFTKIREYGHAGYTYVEGRTGQKFAVIFRNNSAARVLAIPSVDGICAVDGKPAVNDSPGYVVPAYSQIEVKGWRTSLDNVAAFTFEYKGNTYAAKGPLQNTTNCGVIGMKVFAEKYVYTPPPPPPVVIREEHHHHHHHDYPAWVYPRPWVTYSGMTGTAGNAGCAGTPLSAPISIMSMQNVAADLTAGQQQQVASTPQMNLGAGWGQQEYDHVNQVTFERAHEIDTLLVYFSDEPGLRAAGIDVAKNVYLGVQQPSLPQAFGGFCVPPQP